MCTNRRVLLVEESKAVRRLLYDTLGDEGDDVHAAAEGSAALAALDRAAPCLILLDLRMPGMDGWAFDLGALAAVVHQHVSAHRAT